MVDRLKYLRDSFTSPELDESTWTVSGPGIGYFNGSVEFDPNFTATVLESVREYSLTHSHVEAHLGLLGTGQTRNTSMSVRVDADNEVAIVHEADQLIFRVRVAGVNNDTSIDVDLDQMSHWRIEERHGVVYFYTGSDYVNWDRRRVATHGLDLSLVKLRFSVGLDVAEDPDVTYGSGGFGEGFYGGLSGVEPHYAYLYSVNQQTPTPSTVPAVVTAPRAANWRWAVGPWRDEAPSHELIFAGSRSLQLHLKSPSEASFTTWGESEEATFIEEGVSDLWVMRDADTLFRGRVVRANDEVDATSHSLSVSATDYRGVLDRRNLLGEWSTTGIEQAQTVQELVTSIQEQTGGYLGITFETEDGIPATGIARTAEFNEGQSCYECISKLASMDAGFDFDVDENKLFTLYYPERGVDNGEVLDVGGTVARLSRVLNLDRYGNAVRQSGADGVAASNEYAENLSTAPEGRWDLQYGDIELKTSDMVVKSGKAKLQQASQLIPVYTLKLATGAWRGPSHIWLGDYAWVVVKSGRLHDVVKMRVHGISIDVDINNHETVTVTVGGDRVTIASMLNRINRNIRSIQRK